MSKRIVYSQVEKSLKECCKLYHMFQDHSDIFHYDIYMSLCSSIWEFYSILYPDDCFKSVDGVICRKSADDIVNEILD